MQSSKVRQASQPAMKALRKERTRPAARDVFARLSQQLEAFVEQERRSNKAKWTDLEDEKLAQARLALFGSAPK